MSIPVMDTGLASGLLIGLLFGLALEGAGFGSPKKLVNQFTLRDFAVIKVMLSAVLTAALGLLILDGSGLMDMSRVYVPTVFFWAILLGGALIGAGFVIGGFYPGTAVAGLGSGRLDALVFMAGMVIGVWIFAGLFESIEPLYNAAKGAPRQTMGGLIGMPDWLVWVVMLIAGLILFALAGRWEKARGGPLSAGDVH